MTAYLLDRLEPRSMLSMTAHAPLMFDAAADFELENVSVVVARTATRTSEPRILGKWAGNVKASIPRHASSTVEASLQVKTQTDGDVRGTFTLGGHKFKVNGEIDQFSEFKLTYSSSEATGVLHGHVTTAGLKGKF